MPFASQEANVSSGGQRQAESVSQTMFFDSRSARHLCHQPNMIGPVSSGVLLYRPVYDCEKIMDLIHVEDFATVVPTRFISSFLPYGHLDIPLPRDCCLFLAPCYNARSQL